MLQALDYLTFNEIAHRDVKPANILYMYVDNTYTFQLADFGLCNNAQNAVTLGIGTPLYMAPEMSIDNGQEAHSKDIGLVAKADVWSLFMTMLWLNDVGGLRSSSCCCTNVTRKAALDAASHDPQIVEIKDMGLLDPHRLGRAHPVRFSLLLG